MKSKVIVPPRISRAIRGFGLARDILVELLMIVHEGTVRDYESFRHRRMKDDRYCPYRISIIHDGEEHLFVLAIDDTTSPDHLRIADIGHGTL